MNSSSAVRVALVQVEADGLEAVDARIDRVLTMLDDVAEGGSADLDVCAADELDLGARPDLIVLPELWTVGAFDTATMLAHGEAVPGGATVQRVAETAKRHRVWIHAGAYPELAPDGWRANTSVLIAPDGSIAATYRKIHLFGFDEGEAVLLQAGQDQVVTPTPLGNTGLVTCYDLRFPELFRSLTQSGAESFIVPAGWPARRIDHWRVLLRARAIENQAWVLGVNGVGEHAGVLLGGRSAVIDPWGEVVVEALPDRECLVVAELPRGVVDATRAAFPVLRDRRL
jgi:predicted amidohydrolase